MKESPFIAIAGTVQLATYGLVLLLGATAYLMIGHWPSYSHPDPKTLPINFSIPLLPLLFAAIPSVIVYPLCALIQNGKECVKKSHFWIFTIGLFLWTMDLLFFRVSGGLLDWVLD